LLLLGDAGGHVRVHVADEAGRAAAAAVEGRAEAGRAGAGRSAAGAGLVVGARHAGEARLAGAARVAARCAGVARHERGVAGPAGRQAHLAGELVGAGVAGDALRAGRAGAAGGHVARDHVRARVGVQPLDVELDRRVATVARQRRRERVEARLARRLVV